MRSGLSRILQLLGSLLLGSQAQPVLAQSNPEVAAWEKAQRAGTISAYEQFLQQFPLGLYSQDAFVQIMRLAAGETVASPEAVTDPLSNDPY